MQLKVITEGQDRIITAITPHSFKTMPTIFFLVEIFLLRQIYNKILIKYL